MGYYCSTHRDQHVDVQYYLLFYTVEGIDTLLFFLRKQELIAHWLLHMIFYQTLELVPMLSLVVTKARMYPVSYIELYVSVKDSGSAPDYSIYHDVTSGQA
jgi:hypothetical protein